MHLKWNVCGREFPWNIHTAVIWGFEAYLRSLRRAVHTVRSVDMFKSSLHIEREPGRWSSSCAVAPPAGWLWCTHGGSRTTNSWPLTSKNKATAVSQFRVWILPSNYVTIRRLLQMQPTDVPSFPSFWRTHHYDPSWPHISQDSLRVQKRKKERKWRHRVPYIVTFRTLQVCSEGLAFKDHKGRVLQRMQTLNWDTENDFLKLIQLIDMWTSCDKTKCFYFFFLRK